MTLPEIEAILDWAIDVIELNTVHAAEKLRDVKVAVRAAVTELISCRNADPHATEKESVETYEIE